MPATRHDNATRLEGLDAMRGIAALCVLGYHLHTVYGGFDKFEHAYLAVDFFFMLSGFVMARTYEIRFAEGLGVIAFLQQRFARLFLPMAVGATLGLAWFASTGQFEVPRYFATLLFIPDLTLRDPFVLNRPAWSIFFELVANAMHVLVLWRCRTPVVLGIAAMAGATLLWLAFDGNNIALGNHSEDFLGGIARVSFAYCLGIVVYRFGRILPGGAWAACFVLATALISNPGELIGGFVVVGLISPILVMAAARPLSGSAARLLGAISFPLYAVHYPILEASKHYGMPPLFAASVAVMVAMLVARYTDRPARLPWKHSTARAVNAA
ncbi:MAG: acyltransferase [Sphingomonadaceae bacterium]|nr:acyltransferase [Sphingomonadaceae bacterium]MCP5383060.1 acyltransferase [Altererythrobacter sp.]MCP5390342.1 acyltransferase [Sphingomonadaceae bacterium]MCP5393237.1 acyltransferase [Sphingomonadaceae bacterium]